MPELIDDADFNGKLNEIDRNTSHTADFITKGIEGFHLSGFVVPYGYRLVKAKTDHHYRLITDSPLPVTAYAVKLVHHDHIVHGHKSCTQVMVWRSVRPEHRRAIADLPSLFFAHLVEHYNIVISDSQHTESGRRFWETRIIEALSSPELRVYVSDGTQGDRDGLIPLSEIYSDNDFYEIWSEFCWGRVRDVHSHRLFVISKLELL